MACTDMRKTNDLTSSLRGTKSRDLQWLPRSAAVSMLFSLVYLFFRAKGVWSARTADSVIWAALFMEVATAFPRLFTQLSAWCTASKAQGTRLSPPTILDHTKLPRLDIFVTYCGEGQEIVLNTAKAASAQDYPPSLFRVVILDDSGSTDLAKAIATLHATTHPNLHYASRNVQVSTHSKAANLNFGTRFTQSLPDGAGDFFAVLDVDMIPTPHWLRTVLPHLLANPRAGLACPWQRLYNIPPGDPLNMTHDIHLIESLIHLQDFCNESFCTGSGFVVRRDALEHIDGFPEESLQEDILTSVALAAKGWETVYVPESLQWGLAASTFADWVRQRQRWAAGIVSIAQHLTSSSRARDLPFRTRLSGLSWGAVDGSASLIWTVTMFLLPFLILTGRPLLPTPPTSTSSSSYSSSSAAATNDLRFLFHLSLLDFFAQSLHQALLCSLLQWRMSLLAPVSAIYTAPYRLAITLRCYILPKLSGQASPRFTPTGINAALGSAERDARKKNQRTGCVRIVLWECGAWMFAVVLGMCVAGLGVSVQRALDGGRRCDSDEWAGILVFQGLMVRVAWPPVFLLWVVVVKSAWTPIGYAFAPPAFVVERERLLERKAEEGEEGGGVAYPTKEVQRRHMEKHSQVFWLVVAVFFVGQVLVFEGSFGDPEARF